MNQLVTISYEEKLKAEAKARRVRLYGKPKSFNLMQAPKVEQPKDECIKKPDEPKRKRYLLPTQSMIKNEPRSHVDAYEFFQQIKNEPSPIRRHAKLKCLEHGITFEEFQSHAKTRALVAARWAVVRSVNAEFPDVPTTILGKLANKDHSTICHMLGRVKSSAYRMRQYRARKAGEGNG